MDKARQLVGIIDDDPSVRKALGRMVRSLGFQVELYPSGREYLDDPQIRHTACLLIDVSMPEMDGFELHRRLIATGHHVPTIFISAHGPYGFRQSVQSAGCVAFLDKPCDEQALHDALIRAINHEH